MRALGLALGTLLVAGCERALPPAPVAAAADAGPADTASPLPVGTAAVSSPGLTAISSGAGPGALPVDSAQALEGEGAAALDAQQVAIVGPTATFQVRVAVPAREARLVLEDAQGALVPATGSTEVGAGAAYELKPTEPLLPGGSYVLRLEGLASRSVQDAAGRSYQPLSFRLRVTGKEEPPPPRRKRTHRRHGGG